MSDTLSFAIKKLRRMVSLSSTFTGEGASLSDVYTRDLFDLKERPFAIIVGQGGVGSRQISAGSQIFLVGTGNIGLYLARDTPPNLYTDEVQAEIDAAEFFDGVHRDVLDLSGADDIGTTDGFGHLVITGSRVVESPQESHPKHWQSLGRFFWSVIAFEIGL